MLFSELHWQVFCSWLFGYFLNKKWIFCFRAENLQKRTVIQPPAKNQPAIVHPATFSAHTPVTKAESAIVIWFFWRKYSLLYRWVWMEVVILSTSIVDILQLAIGGVRNRSGFGWGMDLNPMRLWQEVAESYWYLKRSVYWCRQMLLLPAESHQKLVAWIVDDIIHKPGSITSPWNSSASVYICCQLSLAMGMAIHQDLVSLCYDCSEYCS